MQEPAESHIATEVMEHVRALRQSLLSGGRDPVGDRERSDLTGPQVAVLSDLATTGPSTVTELAARLHLSHSTMSGIITRLEARKLVTRTPDERDRRVTRVAVAAVVEHYVQDLRSGPFGRLVTVLDAATPQERDVVLDGLTTLRKLLEAG
ncbi:MarR family transcriptional regulator [Pseudonocardia sp. GCM10023141]|uniref:MarR family transcriptional regulator n=1 Tax=Pseudonocardia sp. GCM10023141 TaxID=3252653 RepID=UPI00361E6FA5